MTYQDGRLDRGLVMSVVLHGTLFAFIIFSPRLLPNFAPKWGSPTGTPDVGINAKIVSNISGVPLPTPEVVQENAPANDSPGFYKSEPAPTPAPDKTAEPVPEPKAPIKPPPTPVPDKTAEPVPEPKAPIKTTPTPKPKPPAPPSKSAPTPDTPSNAVPYGEGGRPALAYGQFSTGAGQGAIAGFGDAAFGDRYGWYVTAIIRAISSNWLKSLVDPSVQRAPRVYVSFNIARDGTVNCGDVVVKQSSGIPTLDRSAQRAVCASTFPALPSDYRGGTVSVNFYFEYSR
jgi:TonB family protein